MSRIHLPAESQFEDAFSGVVRIVNGPVGALAHVHRARRVGLPLLEATGRVLGPHDGLDRYDVPVPQLGQREQLPDRGLAVELAMHSDDEIIDERQ